MKHSLKITLILLVFFLLSQVVGLVVVNQYIDKQQTAVTGEIVYKELPIGDRPPLEKETSFIPLFIMLLVGTAVLLLLIKFHLVWAWKISFFIAVVVTLTVALGAFMQPLIAAGIAVALALIKLFRPQIILHNITEVFIYGGLAAIFVPVFSLWSIIILLVLISLYDMYAVWKSKHMITLATFQNEAKVFSGLAIPYQLPKKTTAAATGKTVTVRTAMLGGGDMGFPLLFAGVVMQQVGFLNSLLIPLCAGIALFLLMWKGEEKKFYPAMPFLTLGCLVGYGVVLLVG